MKLCNYAQNNLEMFLATIIFHNLDLISDPPMHSELFIRKVNRYSAGIVLKLVAELWKTLPELTVYPIGNLYTIDTIAEYLGRESDNHVLVMNLL